MYRTILGCVGALLFMLFCSARVEAGPISQCFPPDPVCELIGEFAWTRDDFGDTFALNNLSTGALAGDFTSAIVLLEGGPDSVAFNDDPIATTSEAFPLAPVTLATVNFIFQGVQFSASLSEGDLVFDEFVGNSIQSTLLYASSPIPEPSLVLLLGSGLIVALRRHDRLNVFR